MRHLDRRRDLLSFDRVKETGTGVGRGVYRGDDWGRSLDTQWGLSGCSSNLRWTYDLCGEYKHLGVDILPLRSSRKEGHINDYTPNFLYLGPSTSPSGRTVFIDE